MNAEKVKLAQINVNPNNPRTISEKKLQLLVERLLAFPKMMQLRPIVVDSKMIALGGNMRLRAFNAIAEMNLEEIAETLSKTKNYQCLTAAEQEALLGEWQVWLDAPTVHIVKASTLSELEKREFVIADNASFGVWDYDKLANEWEADDLQSWGVDVWQAETDDADADADKDANAKDLSNKIEEGYKLEVDCGDGEELQRLYNELTERGLECRILTF